MTLYIFLFFVFWGLVVGLMGAARGRWIEGALLGLTLGPFGMFVLLYGWGAVLASAAVSLVLAMVAIPLISQHEEAQKRERDTQKVLAKAQNDAAQFAITSAPETVVEAGPLYICWIGGKDVGPMNADQIKVLLREGKIGRQTPMVQDGATQWGTVADLR